MADTPKVNPADDSEGFVMKCYDGISVTVSSRQATILQEKCEYFKTIFNHGFVESTSRTIVKHDWSSTTTKRLIEMITSKRTNHNLNTVVSETLEEFHELATAADQVLFDIRLISPFNSRIMSREHTKLFTELSNPNNFACSIQLAEPLTLENWGKLLTDGILLSMDWKILVTIGASPERERRIKDHKWYTHDLETTFKFKVYTTDVFRALRSLRMANPDSDDEVGGDDIVVIDQNSDSEDDDDLAHKGPATGSAKHFVLWVSIPMDLLPSINAAVAKTTRGLQLESKWKLGSQLCWITAPTLKVLQNVFSTVRRYLNENRVLLTFFHRVDNNDGQLKAFLSACLHCKEDKGTLCYIEEDCEFRALKTISDMTIMLDHLVQTKHSAPTEAIVSNGKLNIRFFKSSWDFERCGKYDLKANFDHFAPRHTF